MIREDSSSERSSIEDEFELVTVEEKEFLQSKRKYERDNDLVEVQYEWDYPGWGR